ncbi:MAG: ABC transporter permease [Acidobacteriota bacterium]
MMFGRVGVIFKKEILQVLREPRARALLIAPPLIQLIVFGYAVNLDVENSHLAWMDRDRTPESRALRADFEASPYFTIVRELEADAQVEQVLDRGQALAVIRIPENFASDLLQGRKPSIQVLVDGTNSNTAAIASGYISRVVSTYSEAEARDQVAARLVAATSKSRQAIRLPEAGIRLESRIWFNPELRSQDYFVPGVVVNIIGLITVMLTAMAVVREKEIGTLEQLMVTPIRPSELILGKTLPFAVIGLMEVILVTGFALLVFGIPFRGSPLVLLTGAILFLLSTLGSGLLISTLSSTQQQAMMGSFFLFLPSFMLSGFAFPIRNMPVAVQYVTYLNAVRYFLEISRGVFLKGVGFAVLWPQMVGLLALGIAVLFFSSLRFHKRLD